MHAETFTAIGAYAVALLLTLVLVAHLTPRSWWKRPTARALALLAGSTWALGALLLAQLQPWAAGSPTPAQASAAPLQERLAQTPRAGQHYLVRQDLNLRSGSGTATRRLALVPAGATVSATGARDGDWWQLNAGVHGQAVTGWASSLWLRRTDERQAAAP